MSTINQLVQPVSSRPVPAVRGTIAVLLALAAGQTALTIGHFAYGAQLYDDPARLHVVGPAVGFLALAGILAALCLRWPRRWTLALFGAELVAVDIGLFGIYHGAFNHALKDILYAVGVGAERLQTLFDSPDFTMPNDVIYETTGLLATLLAAVIAFYLVRLVGLARKVA